MADPYVYPGTDILRNLADIRDRDLLRDFEIEWTTQRLSEGLPAAELTPHGYQAIHRHIFQDVYPWAGEIRTVTLHKPGATFCLPQYIGPELAKRFDIIASENFLKGSIPSDFAKRAAEHVSELNVIHPFREGNGRTNRAFMKLLAQRAGHELALQTILPGEWLEASRTSFQTGDVKGFERIILRSLEDTPQPEKSLRRGKSKDNGYEI